jgi:hypothetical protein
MGPKSFSIIKTPMPEKTTDLVTKKMPNTQRYNQKKKIS